MIIKEVYRDERKLVLSHGKMRALLEGNQIPPEVLLRAPVLEGILRPDNRLDKIKIQEKGERRIRCKHTALSVAQRGR